MTAHRFLGALVLIAGLPALASAQPRSGVESLLTKDTVGFFHVRIADVWDSPGFAFYRKMLSSLTAEDVKSFDTKFAPNPSQFESLTIVMPSTNVRMPIPDGRPVGESMLWAITTKQPIDRVDLVKGLGLEARTKAHRGTDYLFDEAHWAGILLIDQTTVVVGSEDSIVRLIEQRETAAGESSLAKVFAQEANKHTALLGVNPVVLATPEVLKNTPEPLTPLLKASKAWAALDLKKDAQLTLSLAFATADLAAAGNKAVEELRKMASELIDKGLKELQADEARANKRPLMSLLDMPNHFGPIVGKAALKYLEAAIKGVVVENKDATLRTSVNLTELLPASADAIAVMAFAGLMQSSGGYYYSGRYASDNEEIPYYLKDNLERLSAALQAYHKDNGSFPPAALYDKNGTPLLSWRVLILPYLEQRQGDLPHEGNGPPPPAKFPMNEAPEKRTFADLYKQFKLDEPWDSLNNKKLLERMPRPFRVEFSANNWRDRLEWKTGLQVFTGAGTLFPGRNVVSKGQVRDGVESTIAVVFRDDPQSAVPWTKPLDIPFTADKRLPKLYNTPADMRGSQPQKPPGVFVILADGQLRRLPMDFDERDLKALITIAGGEQVKLPDSKSPKGPKFEEYKKEPAFEKK